MTSSRFDFLPPRDLYRTTTSVVSKITRWKFTICIIFGKFECFFLFSNGVSAELVHSVSENGLTLAVKSFHYLISAPYGVYRRAMSTLHAILDTSPVSNLLRSDVVSIFWRQHIVTSNDIPQLWDANPRQLHLLKSPSFDFISATGSFGSHS